MILNTKSNFFSITVYLTTRVRQADPAFLSTVFEGISNQVSQTGTHRRQIAQYGRQPRFNMLLERASLFFDFLCHVFPNGCKDFRYLERVNGIPCFPGSRGGDRKSTRLNSSHGYISYAVFCLKKKKEYIIIITVPTHNL